MSEILNFILFLLIFWGVILYLVDQLGIPFTMAPLIIILAQIIILYFFALFNILKIGFFVILCISVTLSLLAVFKNKGWPQLFRKLKKPLTLLFLIILIGCFYFTRGTLFHQWDEFSHWGTAYKDLIVTNRLPGENSAVFIIDYPPVMALFQYYIENIISLWQTNSHFESNAYFAQMVFLFSCLLSVFSHSSRRNVIFQLISFAGVFLSVFAFNYAFQSLYVDLSLGVLFAAGLARFINYRKINKDINYFLMLLIVATLPLIRPLGIYFSMTIAICAIILEICSHVLKNQPKSFKVIINSSKKSLKKELIILLLLPILINTTWGFHTRQFAGAYQYTFSLFEQTIDSTEISPPNKGRYIVRLIKAGANERLSGLLYKEPIKRTISIEGVFRTFTANAPFRTRLIIESFIEKIESNAYNNSKLTIIHFLFLILTITVVEIIWISNNDQSNIDRVLIINVFLMIGFIGYLLVLLFAYIYYFYSNDGIGTPSLLRYAGSYLIGWFIVKFGFLQGYIETSSEKSPYRSNVSKWLMTGLFVAAFLRIPLSSYLSLPNTADWYRIKVNSIYKRENLNALPPKSNVYQIWQRGESSNGYELFIMRYLLCPLQSNSHGWRLGVPYNEKDQSTVNFSPREWMSFLNSYGYTHVLLSETDNQFMETYGSLLDKYPEDGYRLYKVFPDSLVQVNKINN